MSLIPTSTDTAEWTPPQAKAVRLGLNIAIGAGLLAGTTFLINAFVPNLTLALTNLTEFVQSLTGMAISVGILMVVGWLMIEIFSKNGKINKLFAQAYSSFINNLTWRMLDIDPITPLEDMRKEALREKATFDEGFAKFDGVIVNFAKQEQSFRETAKIAEGKGRAAKAKFDAGEMRMKAVMEGLLYEAGESLKAAERFRSRREELMPVRENIRELQEAAEVMISSIETDIKIQRIDWEAQKNMGDVAIAGRNILKGGQKKELAQKAAQLIDTKYAYQMGRLRNLADTSRNLIDSVDLNSATYSQEFLTKWQEEANPNQLQQPVPMPMLQDQNAEFAKLVR